MSTSSDGEVKGKKLGRKRMPTWGTSKNALQNSSSTHLRLASVALSSITQKPPIRVICPGRTYRRDADQTHTPMFHQIEGLVIDESATLANLKWVLEEFCKAFFEVPHVGMRFRPSFFPFTSPSLEVDIQCRRSGGEIRFGEGEDWLEILGCGMVHPNVLTNCGLDPEVYQGFAWGIGLDRLAMLKYGLPDLRDFFDADLRWINHYGFKPLDIPTLAGGLSGNPT